jgi:hypothetical protein
MIEIHRPEDRDEQTEHELEVVLDGEESDVDYGVDEGALLNIECVKHGNPIGALYEESDGIKFMFYNNLSCEDFDVDDHKSVKLRTKSILSSEQ